MDRDNALMLRKITVSAELSRVFTNVSTQMPAAYMVTTISVLSWLEHQSIKDVYDNRPADLITGKRKDPYSYFGEYVMGKVPYLSDFLFHDDVLLFFVPQQFKNEFLSCYGLVSPDLPPVASCSMRRPMIRIIAPELIVKRRNLEVLLLRYGINPGDVQISQHHLVGTAKFIFLQMSGADLEKLRGVIGQFSHCLGDVSVILFDDLYYNVCDTCCQFNHDVSMCTKVGRCSHCQAVPTCDPVCGRRTSLRLCMTCACLVSYKLHHFGNIKRCEPFRANILNLLATINHQYTKFTFCVKGKFAIPYYKLRELPASEDFDLPLVASNRQRSSLARHSSFNDIEPPAPQDNQDDNEE